VSLAMNGVIVDKGLYIKVLNIRNSSIANSTITAFNEKFGYFNIQSKDINKVSQNI
jgi:hypothetical protein